MASYSPPPNNGPVFGVSNFGTQGYDTYNDAVTECVPRPNMAQSISAMEEGEIDEASKDSSAIADSFLSDLAKDMPFTFASHKMPFSQADANPSANDPAFAAQENAPMQSAVASCSSFSPIPAGDVTAQVGSGIDRSGGNNAFTGIGQDSAMNPARAAMIAATPELKQLKPQGCGLQRTGQNAVPLGPRNPSGVLMIKSEAQVDGVPPYSEAYGATLFGGSGPAQFESDLGAGADGPGGGQRRARRNQGKGKASRGGKAGNIEASTRISKKQQKLQKQQRKLAVREQFFAGKQVWDHVRADIRKAVKRFHNDPQAPARFQKELRQLSQLLGPVFTGTRMSDIDAAIENGVDDAMDVQQMMNGAQHNNGLYHRNYQPMIDGVPDVHAQHMNGVTHEQNAQAMSGVLHDPHAQYRMDSDGESFIKTE